MPEEKNDMNKSYLLAKADILHEEPEKLTFHELLYTIVLYSGLMGVGAPIVAISVSFLTAVFLASFNVQLNAISRLYPIFFIFTILLFQIIPVLIFIKLLPNIKPVNIHTMTRKELGAKILFIAGIFIPVFCIIWILIVFPIVIMFYPTVNPNFNLVYTSWIPFSLGFGGLIELKNVLNKIWSYIENHK